MKQSDLSEEMKHWWISVLIIMPLVVGPGIVWHAYLLTKLARSADHSTLSTIPYTQDILFFNLADCILLNGLFLLSLILWHWPLLVINRNSIPFLLQKMIGYPFFIMALSGIFIIPNWLSAERASCLYETAHYKYVSKVSSSFGFFSEPCPVSDFQRSAGYLILGMIGVLLLRALIFCTIGRLRAAR